MESLLFPIIMLAVTLIGGGILLLFLKTSKKPPQTDAGSTAMQTAQQFINVKDIRDKYLYTRGGMVFIYLRIHAISIDLYSKSEKNVLIKTLTAELSDIQYQFKFMALSRPVDISPLITEMSEMLKEAEDKRKELLRQEILQMGGFALSGEIVERQFYIALWEKQEEGIERDLLKRASLLCEKFATGGVTCDILTEKEIVRLINLVNNPSYTHLEDAETAASIPVLKDRNGGLVIVDTWKRGGDRTNSNFCVMGNSGVGKSTAIKHILLSEYMKGTRIIVIDPESEYKELCQNLNGDWINAAGGSKGMINPLQVRPSPRDDEDEKEELRLYRDEGYGMNDLALHMKNLEIFFSLYIPSLTDMQKAVLKRCLVELYQKFHITWDTDVTKLESQDFPIFSDLYALVQEKTKTEKGNQVYAELVMLLYDIAEGADSFIWNGHTSISGNSRFTVMDTHALQETGDNIKRTQYFNILTYDWEQMSRDREERVLLICDEAYLMIDQKVPQSLVYLRNVMKRARKYEAALGIISHSLVDFLHESIKQYGQALLDIPCYKILMGTDGKNLKETADLYDLTEAEQELLLSRKRGHALFMAGAKRLHIQFDIPEYKFNYMGKGGGR